MSTAQVEVREAPEAENKEAKEVDLNATPEVTPAPNERDRAIYKAVYLDCQSEEEVARRYSLALTTVRNVALNTQRKLAKRQFEIEQFGSKESLLLYHGRLDSQLRFVNDRMRADNDGRTAQSVVTKHGTPVEGEKTTFGKVTERTTTTVRKDPNVVLRHVAMAHRILKEMWGVECQVRQLVREEKEERKRRKEKSPKHQMREQLRDLERINLLGQNLSPSAWMEGGRRVSADEKMNNYLAEQRARAAQQADEELKAAEAEYYEELVRRDQTAERATHASVPNGVSAPPQVPERAGDAASHPAGTKPR